MGYIWGGFIFTILRYKITLNLYKRQNYFQHDRNFTLQFQRLHILQVKCSSSRKKRTLDKRKIGVLCITFYKLFQQPVSMNTRCHVQLNDFLDIRPC